MPEAPVTSQRDARARRWALHRRVAPGHIIMVVAGLVAFLLTYAALRDDADYLEVAVAAADLRVGTPLETSMLSTVRMALVDSAAPPGVLSLAEAEAAIADGAVIANAVPAGSLLRSADVARETIARPRAMALPIDRAHAVDGVLRSGDVIDIVVVESGAARFALVGIPVLAVTDTGGAGRTVVLTVELDAASSLRLAHAMSVGSLQVVRATGAVPATTDSAYPARPGPREGESVG